MCSSTRGPASVPSLVTWPTSTIGAPLALAMRVSCAAHSRTWATEPGAEVSCSEYTVWIESMTQKSGASASIAARIFSSWISASTRTREPSRPRRRARSATCAPLSSPVTYSTFMLRRQRVDRLQQQRALADAGVAADQHHAAGDDAAAEHAVELLLAGGRARDLGGVDLGQRGHRAAPWPATGSGGALPAADSATVSSSVFQALQCGHLPSHFGLVPPHSLQV